MDVTLGTQTSTTYTILDDDTLSVEFSQAVGDDIEVNGGNLPQLLVSGQVQAGHSVNIDVSVTGGTASATDYVAPTTLNVGGGTYASTAFAIPSLQVVDDAIVEPNETITLGNIAGVDVTIGTQTSTTYTILDDDTLSVEFSQAVGDDVEASGGNLPQLLVSGQVQAGHSVNVDVSVTGGTASAADYVAPTTLNVGGGIYASTAFAIPSLQVVDENLVEADETLTLGGIIGSQVLAGAQNSTTYTVTDDDVAQITVDDVTVDEGMGTATFTIDLSSPVDTPLDVWVEYTDQTATGAPLGTNADYDNHTDAITFPANDTTSQSVTVAITDDNQPESSETFLASLAVTTSLNGRNVGTSDQGIRDDYRQRYSGRQFSTSDN